MLNKSPHFALDTFLPSRQKIFHLFMLCYVKVQKFKLNIIPESSEYYFLSPEDFFPTFFVSFLKLR